tara:strand:+ start:2561 stop:2746 length:186 start_codon:yes stop_codon:yes gene_type:complete
MFLEFLQMMIFKIRDGIVGFINGMLPLLLIVVLIYTIINAYTDLKILLLSPSRIFDALLKK